MAAPDAENGSTERGAAEAERIFAATFGPPAGGRLVIVGPLLAALERLDRESALMAELNGWRPPQAAGLSFLEQLVGSEADARREEGRRPPRHVGFFVKPLLAEARRVHRKRRQREQPPATPREPPPRDQPNRERPADTAAGRAVQRMLREARQYDRLAAANPRWAETYRREADRLRQEAMAKAELESHPLPQRG